MKFQTLQFWIKKIMNTSTNRIKTSLQEINQFDPFFSKYDGIGNPNFDSQSKLLATTASSHQGFEQSANISSKPENVPILVLRF